MCAAFPIVKPLSPQVVKRLGPGAWLQATRMCLWVRNVNASCDESSQPPWAGAREQHVYRRFSAVIRDTYLEALMKLTIETSSAHHHLQAASRDRKHHAMAATITSSTSSWAAATQSTPITRCDSVPSSPVDDEPLTFHLVADLTEWHVTPFVRV